MSDSPRTDAALQNTNDGKGCATSALYVFASFSRTLERELAAALNSFHAANQERLAERAVREQAEARLAEKDRIYLERLDDFEKLSKAYDVLKLKLEAAKGSLELACVASCSCQTKTSDYEYHSESCRYKALAKVLAQLNAP